MSLAQTKMPNASKEKLKPFRVRKCAKRIVLILALGTALSLLQAWGSIVLNDVGGFHPFDWHRYDYIVNERIPGQGPGYLHGAHDIKHGLGPMNEAGHAWWFNRKFYHRGIESVRSSYVSGDRSQIQWSTEHWGELADTLPPPSWSATSHQVVETNDPSFANVYEVVAGWPMQSWYGAIWWVDGADKGSHRWSLSYWKIRRMDPSLLPFKPLRGLWINAMLFGSIAYAAFGVLYPGAGFVRRFKRRRNGQCTNCAYNITALTTCPECGQAVGSKPAIKPNTTQS